MSSKNSLCAVRQFSLFRYRAVLLSSRSTLLMPSRVNIIIELYNSTYTDPDLANAKPFADIPGLKGFWNSLITASKFLPFIGEFKNGIDNLNEIHKERHQLYGDILRLDLFGTKLVMVHDPEDIRKVFRHEGQHPHRIMLHGLKEYRDNLQSVYPSSGILTENGIKWFNIRSQVQVPMLRPQIVETYISGMDEVSEDFIKRMKCLRDSKKEVPNYLNELYKWALESIGLVAFNTRLGCLNADEQLSSETQLLIKAVGKSMENVSKLEFGLPLWKYFPSRAYKEFCRAQDFIFRIALKYFNQTVEEIQKSKDNVSVGGILGVYIRNRKLDQKEIRTFMMDLLQAGIDTVKSI